MPTNLGRDTIWSPEVWSEIDTAVQAEVGRLRVAQKVFPATQSADSQYVPVDVFDRNTMTISEGQTKPYIEISVEFSLTQTQVANEAGQGTGRTLARMAAKVVAQLEDEFIFQGEDGTAARAPRTNIRNPPAKADGIVNLPNIAAIPVAQLGNAPEGVLYGSNTFAAVVQAIARLIDLTQPGPYALILESSIYADTYAPLPDTLVTTADRLTPLLTGGFYGSGAMPDKTGVLISLGGDPATLYLDQDAITAYTQEDQNGVSQFRVFERVQFVARDQEAFVRLEFA